MFRYPDLKTFEVPADATHMSLQPAQFISMYDHAGQVRAQIARIAQLHPASPAARFFLQEIGAAGRQWLHSYDLMLPIHWLAKLPADEQQPHLAGLRSFVIKYTPLIIRLERDPTDPWRGIAPEEHLLIPSIRKDARCIYTDIENAYEELLRQVRMQRKD